MRISAKLWTSVYHLNLAPIAAKLRQRAVREICNFRFFDADLFLPWKKIRLWNSVFRHFWQILDELDRFWRQNQIPRKLCFRWSNFQVCTTLTTICDFSPLVHGPWAVCAKAYWQYVRKAMGIMFKSPWAVRSKSHGQNPRRNPHRNPRRNPCRNLCRNNTKSPAETRQKQMAE